MTSPSPRLDLDHVGFIVRDLEASSDLLSALGFTPTTRADHTRTDASGAAVSAGSSQRSIVLDNGYIEIMQITDPRAGHQLAPAPAVRHGLHILAFGTDDAESCRRTRAHAGLEVGPVLRWARPVREIGLQGTARFAYFGADWRPTDPSYLCWVEHLTPELVRSPELLRHENGARRLTGLAYRGPGAEARLWIDRLRAAGARPSTEDPGSGVLTTGNAWLRVEIDETATSVLPVALELEFRDVARLRDRCARLGVAFETGATGETLVDLRSQLGVEWICREAGDTAVG